MEQSSGGTVETGSFTVSVWIAIVLVLTTGIVHVYAGFVEGRIPVLLAGLGFFGGLVAFILNYRRGLLYLVGIVYTAVQFPLWYVAKAGEYTTLGYVDKTLQAILIVVLAYLYWRHRRTPESRQSPSAT